MIMSDCTWGLITSGSPPSDLTASRIVAMSTTQGTPVKSCITTREWMNWISMARIGRRIPCEQFPNLLIRDVGGRRCCATRFSTSTFSEYGR